MWSQVNGMMEYETVVGRARPIGEVEPDRWGGWSQADGEELDGWGGELE